MISPGKIIMMCLLLTTPSWAQNLISVQAGLINFAEGNVYAEERQLQYPTYVPQILKVGESLSTGFGWVEIQLGPGAYLRMGTGGLLKMENTDFANMQFRVNQGSIMVEIFDEIDDNKIRIHFRNAAIELKEKGLYRIDCSLSRLRVYGGKAEMLHSQRKTTLKRGKAAFLGDMTVSEFDTEERDLLHQWSARRSFVLYLINEEIRQQWKHWKHWIPLNSGWMQNEFYGVQAFSTIAQEEQDRRLELEQRSLRALQQMQLFNSSDGILIRLPNLEAAIKHAEQTLQR